MSNRSCRNERSEGWMRDDAGLCVAAGLRCPKWWNLVCPDCETANANYRLCLEHPVWIPQLRFI